MQPSDKLGNKDVATQVDAVVLAAGVGSRLSAVAPVKPLADVCGRPLIAHVLDGLVRAGIANVIVVTGYCADALSGRLAELSKHLPITVRTVQNPDFQLSNGVSVLAARPYVNKPFLLAMADHLFDPEILHLLLEEGLGNFALKLAVDRRLDNPDVDLDDVTRVATRADRIVCIGKDLQEFDAFDTGLFYATPELFEALEDVYAATGDASLSKGVQRLANKKHAAVLDIGARFWLDVDNPDMLARARAWVAHG